MTKKMKSKKTHLDFKFKCGCFIRCYISINGDLKAGMACCKGHDHAYAKAEDFYLCKYDWGIPK